VFFLEKSELVLVIRIYYLNHFPLLGWWTKRGKNL